MWENNEKRSFAKYLFNREEGTILGRTPISFIKLLVFYAVFYTALLALWFGCWCVFIRQINTISPYRRYPDTFIQPGINHIPSLSAEFGYVTLFEEEMRSLYEKYDYDVNQTERYKILDCNYDTKINHSREFCKVDIDILKTGCTSFIEGSFNKQKNTVDYCKILKLKKIYGWEPDYYSNKEAAPETIKTLMDNIRQGDKYLKRVWVTCEALMENESIDIEFEYIPEQGFPGYYFPFMNANGYQSPLIVVKYSVENGKLSKIICTAWANDIKDGTTTFYHKPAF